MHHVVGATDRDGRPSTGRYLRTGAGGLVLLGALATTGCTPPPGGQAGGGPLATTTGARPEQPAAQGLAGTAWLNYRNPGGGPLPAALAFYTEITVQRSVPGTVFIAEGFARGSYGLQETDDGDTGRRYLRFEVHDPPRGSVSPADEHATVSDAAPQVRVTPSGQGRNGPTLRLPLDWQPDTRYRLLLVAKVNGGHVDYSPYVFDASGRRPHWLRLAIVHTVTSTAGLAQPGTQVQGVHPLPDDGPRTATLRNGWWYTTDHRWQQLTAVALRERSRLGDDSGVIVSAVPGGFSLTTGDTSANPSPSSTNQSNPGNPQNSPPSPLPSGVVTAPPADTSADTTPDAPPADAAALVDGT